MFTRKTTKNIKYLLTHSFFFLSGKLQAYGKSAGFPSHFTDSVESLYLNIFNVTVLEFKHHLCINKPCALQIFYMVRSVMTGKLIVINGY